MATIEDVYEFLKHTAPTYMLATVDEEGNPRVRPFGTADLFEGRLYIQTGKKKEVYKQIVAHPEVERIEAKKHMLDAYPGLRKMYDENDDNTIVLYFRHATATFTSLAGKPSETVSW